MSETLVQIPTHPFFTVLVDDLEYRAADRHC
jgi:hypothetical protein